MSLTALEKKGRQALRHPPERRLGSLTQQTLFRNHRSQRSDSEQGWTLPRLPLGDWTSWLPPCLTECLLKRRPPRGSQRLPGRARGLLGGWLHSEHCCTSRSRCSPCNKWHSLSLLGPATVTSASVSKPKREKHTVVQYTQQSGYFIIFMQIKNFWNGIYFREPLPAFSV